MFQGFKSSHQFLKLTTLLLYKEKSAIDLILNSQSLRATDLIHFIESNFASHCISLEKNK